MDGRSRLICDECGTPYDAPTDEVNDPCLEPGCRDGVLRERDEPVRLGDGSELPVTVDGLALSQAMADAFTLPADAAVLAEVDDADLFGLADVQDEEDGQWANARLIAAAPSLLAACEDVRQWIKEDTLVDLDELSDDAKRILRIVEDAIREGGGS